ncbi:MAG: FapA family protein, partial [Spirochaetaceae bacterium]|nr:FapA family protein [Spirochaetaceae bacterium]
MKKSKERTDKPETPESPNAAGPQNRTTVLTNHKHDGKIFVTFSEGDIEAYADFIPPIGHGAPITPEYVSAVLERLNIVYGVQEADIQNAILQCNLDKRPLKQVLIAKGSPSEDEILERYELSPDIVRMPAPVKPGDRIDYRSQSPFIIVKKDQILAAKQPHQTGLEGINVHGISIPYRVLRLEGVLGGKNTRTDENYIYAEVDGQLVESQKTLHVEDALTIKGPVGYGTGNIIFPGDVAIDGPVSDGFIIHSGGSVTIKQTFDVTDVITRNDLVVSGGIIGRGQALVKVGGSLKTKFIENCRVACRKTITVEADIVNCSIYAMEIVDLGDKGIIIGGDITAVRGVRAGGIGKKTGKPTHIHCGLDFTVQQEKEKCNYRMRLISAKLTRLREAMAAPIQDPEKRVKMEELLQRLEAEQRKLGRRISDLLSRLETAPDAAVEVSGEIAPGTLIEICQIALLVEEPLRKVRITLDRPSGKLATKPLT